MKRILSYLFFVLLFFPMTVDARKIYINCTPVDEGKDPVHRVPIVIPEVTQDGYELTFDESCISSTVVLLDDDENIVYLDIVDANGSVLLPTYLSGEYKMLIYIGQDVYYGIITL